MGADKIVIVEPRIRRLHPADFICLAGAQGLVRIEAPDTVEQALTPQHFVATGDAAFEVVRHIEKGTVAVGDLRVEREQFIVDAPGRDCGVAARQ